MDQVAIYTSPVIPPDFRHGFPERTGGVSTGLRSSLNVGTKWGDDPTNVEENLRRIATVAGFARSAMLPTRHIHGTTVWDINQAMPAEFDGLVANQVGPVLAAFAADCLPIVFADPIARVIGACHAGWRGTVGQMAVRVVEHMQALGSRSQDVRVAIGPSIGPCCFEVGDEVVSAFEAALGTVPNLIVQGRSKPHIDLRIATMHQLTRAGVLPAHIDAAPPCTRCNPGRFFSYRRDGQAGGVHLGFIQLRPVLT